MISLKSVNPFHCIWGFISIEQIGTRDPFTFYAVPFLRVTRMTAQPQLCPSLMPGGDTHFPAQYNLSSNMAAGGDSTNKMVPNARMNSLAFSIPTLVESRLCACICVSIYVQVHVKITG